MCSEVFVLFFVEDCVSDVNSLLKSLSHCYKSAVVIYAVKTECVIGAGDFDSLICKKINSFFNCLYFASSEKD